MNKNRKHTEETKRKISEARKGKCMGNKNPAKRPEVRRKISEALKGDKNPAKRPEVKRKLSKARMGNKNALGCKRSEETRRKLSEAKKGKYTGVKNPNWQGGVSFEPYPPSWTKELKQSIRQRDNFVCQLCGKYTAYDVHHIDYVKENCEPDNLITLCKSCHSKVNFDRSSWTTYFQNKLEGGQFVYV